MHLQSIAISPAEIGFEYSKNINITYQIFGRTLGTARIILVNHALTGNSTVTGPLGWWNQLIGDGLTINTEKYTVLAFDIPGNGYDQNEENLHADYKKFNTKIIAQIFWKAIDLLKIKKLHGIIGGSLGGAIGWEMLLQKPNKTELFIPIACNYKASDWLIGNVFVQDSILNHSKNPMEDARMHAMLLYRTPQSFQEKFHLKQNSQTQNYKVEEWLEYHGKALKDRYSLQSYRLMNHLLKTIGNEISETDFEDCLEKTAAQIVIIAITSDYMFTENEQYQTYLKSIKTNNKARFQSINSIHGHDAFLMENEQLNHLLQPYF